jgi:hypothetical protein
LRRYERPDEAGYNQNKVFKHRNNGFL